MIHWFNFIKNRNRSITYPISALLLISGLFMFAFGMFSPIYAIFVQKIGGSITVASNAYALYWLVAGVLTFVMGKLENKLKETELAIMWSQFIMGLAYLMYYFSSNIIMLYLTQIIMGIGAAIFWPAFHAVYTKHVNGKKSAWQWSLYDGLAYILPALAAVLGGRLVVCYGFNIIFLIMAALSFVCALFILFLPRKVL